MFFATITQHLSNWIESVKGNLPVISQLANKEISLFIISLLFFLLTFCIVVYILLRRIYINEKHLRSEKRISVYQNLLIMYITGNKKEREDLIKEFRACHSDILLAQILVMKKSFTGVEGLVLDNLYQNLNYNQLSANKLRNLYWTSRLHGLEEHTLMKVSMPKVDLHNLVHDRKSLVRIAALKYEILRGGNWQALLVGYTFTLSLWEQIQLCETIYQKPNFNFRDCMVLKTSSNPSVSALYSMLEQPFTQLQSSDLVSQLEESFLLN